jgi:tRNA pseudouridine55 synthase
VPFSDGVLVIDKPSGPTSHDVVAVVRRAARLSSADPRRPAMKVGHTGTLDPLASGVLPLVLGRATRLAQFLSSAEKEYVADLRLGFSTTTYDSSGTPLARSSARDLSTLTSAEIDNAIAGFRGNQLQQPPTFSAKKVDGDRAYDLARRQAAVRLQPAEVTVHVLDIVEWHHDRLRLRLTCSAGFYVRSLAHDIGERLGTGAHLAQLVRTRSGDFGLDQAVSLEVLDRRPAEASARVIPLNVLLPSLPALTLTEKGAALAAKGGFISPAHLEGVERVPVPGKVRLFHPDGHLVAIAEERPSGPAGLLHPGVVLE